MNDEKKAALIAAGVNVDDAMERLMDNEALLVRLLKMVDEDENISALIAAAEAGECEKAFRAAHTIKGFAGNLSLEGPLTVLLPLTERLRAGDMTNAVPDAKEVAARIEAIMAVVREM